MKITLTELRQIVKSIVKEQLANNDTSDAVTSATSTVSPFVGRTIQFYSDAANTQKFLTVKITDFTAHGSRTWGSTSGAVINTNEGKDFPIMFECKDTFVTYRSPKTNNKPMNLYNNKFIQELKNSVCKK